MSNPAVDGRALSVQPAEPLVKKAQSRRRIWLTYACLTFLLVALAVALLRGWRELTDHPWEIDRLAAIQALGLWSLTNLAAALCWITVTRAFGVRLPIALALRVFSTSNLGKYLPGKVLHVVARVYLVQQQGVSVGVGTTSAMLDVLLYIAAGMVLGLFALPGALPPELRDYQEAVMAGLLVAVLIGFALLHPRSLNAIIRTVGRFVPRLRGLRFELSYGTILAAFVMYILLWLVVTAAVWATVRSITPIAVDRAPILGAIFALSYVAGLFIPTPAGVGREAVVAWLFSTLMPTPAAVVAAILMRLLQLVSEAIIAGLLSLLVRR